MSWRETLQLTKLFIGNKEIETQFHEVVFTIGGEISNTRNVQIKFTHPSGLIVAGDAVVADFYLADDADGLIPTTVPPNNGIASAGHLIEEVDNRAGKIITPAGLATFPPSISLAVKDTGAKTVYLVVIQKCGRIDISSAITLS